MKRAVPLALLFCIGGLAAQTAPPVVFRSRGVHYFAGSFRCPLAGAGTRGANDCNRVALDDDHSTVTIDPAARRIVVTNTHQYSRKQDTGELLFLANASTDKGEKAPVAVHLQLSKWGNRFFPVVHLHPTVRDKMVSADLEPFEVVAANGSTQEVVLNQAKALNAIRNPDVTARLAKILVDVRDNLEGVKQDPAQPEFRLADISVGLGSAPMAKMMMRAQLVSLDGANRPIIVARSIPEMFRRGSWELRLTALSSLIPKEEFQRDLFVMGLDRMPLFQGVMKYGLRKGETMRFRLVNGEGTAGVGNQTASMPRAVDVSRDYMEFHWLGSILARQITHPVSGARR